MIRITVERIEYQTKNEDGSIGMLVDYEPLGGSDYRRRELLRQEMDDSTFDLAAILCVLNNLEPEPLCKCGHESAMHPGGARCQYNVQAQISGRQCDCMSYRSLHQERLRTAEKALVEMRTERDRSLEKANQLELGLRSKRTAINVLRGDLGRARTTLARLREKNRSGR